jgi:hypothetical protein
VGACLDTVVALEFSDVDGEFVSCCEDGVPKVLEFDSTGVCRES